MAAAQKQATEAAGKREAAEKEVADLKAAIGSPRRNDVKTIRDGIINDVNSQVQRARTRHRLPDDQKNLKKVLTEFANTVNTY